MNGQQLELFMQYGYTVKYSNGTIMLPDRRWRSMFSADKLKLGDLKYALKHYKQPGAGIDTLPWYAKFRRYKDTDYFELYQYQETT